MCSASLGIKKEKNSVPLKKLFFSGLGIFWDCPDLNIKKDKQKMDETA
jgi:hypothetical protein